MTIHNNILHVIPGLTRDLRTTLLCLSAVLFTVSCTKPEISLNRGAAYDNTAPETRETITFYTKASPSDILPVFAFQGGEEVSETIVAVSSAPVEEETVITFDFDPELVNGYSDQVEYTFLHEAYYRLSDNKFVIKKGETQSNPVTVTIIPPPLMTNVWTRHWLLPLVGTVEGNVMDVSPLYIDIKVEGSFAPAPLHKGDEVFSICYVNTATYDPRLAMSIGITKAKREYDSDGNYMGIETLWTESIGNIVNLRKTVLKYDTVSERTTIDLSPDMKYVLEHRDRYIAPLQESGRKVCICIEGGMQGIGFCNMTDAQIADFVSSAVRLLDVYSLDGINLWDRNSAYDKAVENGFSQVNTTSYPKLIKELKSALDKAFGKKKLLTLVDHEAPTEYFWDTKATDGIKVGTWLDYAWSGYCDAKDGYQVVDPFNQGGAGVSTLYPRKPIAGLGRSKYGCIMCPQAFNGQDDAIDALKETQQSVKDWVSAGCKTNNIAVYTDLESLIQPTTESRLLYEEIFLLFNRNSHLWIDGDVTQESYYSSLPGFYNTFLKDW